MLPLYIITGYRSSPSVVAKRRLLQLTIHGMIESPVKKAAIRHPVILLQAAGKWQDYNDWEIDANFSECVVFYIKTG